MCHLIRSQSVVSVIPYKAGGPEITVVTDSSALTLPLVDMADIDRLVIVTEAKNRIMSHCELWG